MGIARSITKDELSEIRDLLSGIGENLDRAARGVEEYRGNAHANMLRTEVSPSDGSGPLVAEVPSNGCGPMQVEVPSNGCGAMQVEAPSNGGGTMQVEVPSNGGGSVVVEDSSNDGHCPED